MVRAIWKKVNLCLEALIWIWKDRLEVLLNSQEVLNGFRVHVF